MASTSLATVAQLKTYLGITSAADDALLQTLLDAASEWFQVKTGQSFGLNTITETRSGDGTAHMSLRNRPVIDVSAVAISGDIVPKSTSTTDAGWYLQDGTIHLRGYAFQYGHGNITVSYSAGYAEVPADVRQAVIEHAAFMYRQRTRIGEMSKTIAGESVSFQTVSVPVGVQSVVDAYTRLSV